MTRKEKLEKNELNTVREDLTIGYPMTPGHWAGEPEYKNVTKITMTSGYTYFSELVEQVGIRSLTKASTENKPLKLKTYDGRTIILNLRYMIKAEDFTMVTRNFLNDNPNFTKGIYTYRWLLPLNETAEFVNDWYRSKTKN